VEREALDQLDALRPHIGRAILIAARLRLERARAATATLAVLGFPALVLDDQRKVLAANELGGGLADHLIWRARDGVTLRDRAADTLFTEALSKSIRSAMTESARSLRAARGMAVPWSCISYPSADLRAIYSSVASP
jgi:hypothetical protein